MKEKLVIKNFGPIKSVDLELNRFNIFIGDQGTGKSTVAKLLIAIQNTFFRDFWEVVSTDSKSKESLLFFEHLDMLGIHNYLFDNTEIIFSSSKFSFQLKRREVILVEKTISDADKVFYDFNYIPSERSLAVILLDSLFALIQIKAELPYLFTQFGNKFQKARRELTQFDYTSILRANYAYKNDKDVILLPNGTELPFHESSSGIQSAITLLLVFDYIMKTNGVGNLLVIEEPELNCFPDTQNKLMKHFISKNINEQDDAISYYRNRLFFTTHSPYILTSVNNLMAAYTAGSNHEKEVEKIIEKKFWLDPKDVSAYMMLADGTCENIMDAKEGLIKADKIDSVSKVLNEQFDSLVNLEFKD